MIHSNDPGRYFNRLLGGLLEYLAVFALFRGRKSKQHGRVVSGIVVGCKQRRVDAASRSYFPEVAFRTTKGEQIVFTSSSGSSKIPALGRHVSVLYYPDDPKAAHIASSGNLWFTPIMLMVFASSFLVVAILFFADALKNPR